jgi:hypothetical protein
MLITREPKLDTPYIYRQTHSHVHTHARARARTHTRHERCTSVLRARAGAVKSSGRLSGVSQTFGSLGADARVHLL